MGHDDEVGDAGKGLHRAQAGRLVLRQGAEFAVAHDGAGHLAGQQHAAHAHVGARAAHLVVLARLQAGLAQPLQAVQRHQRRGIGKAHGLAAQVGCAVEAVVGLADEQGVDARLVHHHRHHVAVGLGHPGEVGRCHRQVVVAAHGVVEEHLEVGRHADAHLGALGALEPGLHVLVLGQQRRGGDVRQHADHQRVVGRRCGCSGHRGRCRGRRSSRRCSGSRCCGRGRSGRCRCRCRSGSRHRQRLAAHQPQVAVAAGFRHQFEALADQHPVGIGQAGELRVVQLGPLPRRAQHLGGDGREAATRLHLEWAGVGGRGLGQGRPAGQHGCHRQAGPALAPGAVRRRVLLDHAKPFFGVHMATARRARWPAGLCHRCFCTIGGETLMPVPRSDQA